MMAKPKISTVVDKVANRFETKPDQKKAIVVFFNGSDVFASLPTGSGKSFCYWCLHALTYGIITFLSTSMNVCMLGLYI